MELHRSRFTVPITQLEEWLDLPEGTNIANVEFSGFSLTIQFLSDTEIEKDAQVHHVKDIGHIYRALKDD